MVQMVNCQFTNNQAIGPGAGATSGTYPWNTAGGAYGGAVYELGGTVTNVNGSFVGNQALAASFSGGQNTDAKPGQGGACFNSGGLLVVSGTSFTYNTVRGGDSLHWTSQPGQGGAIYSSGTLQVSNCNFGYNQAVGGSDDSPGTADGDGGAIFCNGPLSIGQSWFFGNEAFGGVNLAGNNYAGSYWGYHYNGSGRGGAIYNNNPMSITGCTFSTNQVFGNNGSSQVGPNFGALASWGFGGAIYNLGSCQLTNNTLVGNSAVPGNAGYVSGAPGLNGCGGAVCNDGDTAT